MESTQILPNSRSAFLAGETDASVAPPAEMVQCPACDRRLPIESRSEQTIHLTVMHPDVIQWRRDRDGGLQVRHLWLEER